MYRYLAVRRSGDRHRVWWGAASILCEWRCSVFCATQRSVHCTVQHSLSTTAFCALYCATEPVHYSVLCTALCNTACPLQRSVHCTVQRSMSSSALCALHRWCSIWRLKTVTAAVRLLGYRNKKLFVWAVTDRQTDVRHTVTVASAVGGFVSFSGDADRLWGSPSLLFDRYLFFFPVDKPAGA